MTDHAYAAQAALNMALDDAVGRVQERNIAEIYGARPSSGVILESIGILDSEDALRQAITDVYRIGRIPKIKCDQNLAQSVASLRVAMAVAASCLGSFAADFNATLVLEQWAEVLKQIAGDKNFATWSVAEQPTRECDGMAGIEQSAFLSRCFSGPKIVADESFLEAKDALACGRSRIGLNLKIQKLGGIVRALELESLARSVAPEQDVRSMIGGTFPTALGRAYDQLAASILTSATLPSDGWQPASSWFRDELHLIEEPFAEPSPGRAAAFSGSGLGCTPVWDRIRRFQVPDPEAEYRAIRSSGAGNRLRIQIRETDGSYAALYERVCGRSFMWNL